MQIEENGQMILFTGKNGDFVKDLPKILLLYINNLCLKKISKIVYFIM